MKAPRSRRQFLSQSLFAAAAAASMEERQLLAQSAPAPATIAPVTSAPLTLPQGRIGKLEISRLICGGNLISGFAHSRDLIYVSPLLKHYFTDDKVIGTLSRCEARGINTAILRLDDNTIRILKRYRETHGNTLQWIAQIKAYEDDLTSEASRAVDNGAVAAFVHGGVGDSFVQDGKVKLLARAVEHIKTLGVPAGVAGHSIEVPKACEEADLGADFYMKTFNSKRYWSAGPVPRHDSVWEETPEETMDFMSEVDKPWIAYKVLGAGAIHPREGFRYAFNHGADFVCAGMFDFQIDEDAQIAEAAVSEAANRDRLWA